MADTYSTNLALILQATGSNSGTWGDLTNTNIGTLLEQAVSGYVTLAITDGADTTITIPNGATGVARNMFIEMTGALTAARNLIVPSNKKIYFCYNNTTGGYAVTVKVTGLTGISVPNGRKCLLVSNGTDIVEAHNAIVGNATVGGTLGVTGVVTLTAQPILSSLTASAAVATDGSKGLVSVTNTGTGNNVLSASPTLTGTLTAATVRATSTTFHQFSTSTGSDYCLYAAVTNVSTAFGFIVSYTACAPNDTGNGFITCTDSATTRATLRSNGGLANYSANNANLSDARLKTTLIPLSSYWSKWQALEFGTFFYKDQTDDIPNIGVIAQQVESVAPEFIDNSGVGETPADGIPIKAIWQTDMFMAMGKVVQECQARIQALEARVRELEAVK